MCDAKDLVGAECYHFAPTFLKLWLNGFCDFFGTVGVNVIDAFLDGVGKFLNDFRVFLHIAFLCTVCGIGNVAGIFA